MKKLIILLLAAALLFCSCDDSGYGIYHTYEETDETQYDCGFAANDTALTVQGHDIPFSELRYTALYLAEMTDTSHLTDERAVQTWFTEQVVPDILFRRAVALLAEELGVKLSGDEIDEIDALIKSNKEAHPTEHAEQLAEANLTDSLYRFIAVSDSLRASLISYYQDEATTPVKASDEAILAAATDGTVAHVKHILIRDNAGEDSEENKALAEELLSRINAGEDFDTLMAEYSEDPSLSEATDGYHIFPYEMAPAFESAAYALAEGEVSGVVRAETDTYAGWHIIKREPIDTEYVEENLDTLRKNYTVSRFYGDVYDTQDKLFIKYAGGFSDLTLDNMR